jgi:hypothetical protein
VPGFPHRVCACWRFASEDETVSGQGLVASLPGRSVPRAGRLARQVRTVVLPALEDAITAEKTTGRSIRRNHTRTAIAPGGAVKFDEKRLSGRGAVLSARRT